MTDKETTDPTLINLATEPMQIYMRRAWQETEFRADSGLNACPSAAAKGGRPFDRYRRD